MMMMMMMSPKMCETTKRVLDRARIPDFRPTANGQALKHRYRCSKAVGVFSVQH